MAENNRALTIKEVAEFLNISNQMVYNLIKSRELQAFKIGSALRILHSDLYEYIEKQKKLFEAKSADFANKDFMNTDESLFVVHMLNAEEGEFHLQDISFSFPRGKILALLGVSGSGKTLLLRSLAGLKRITNGSVYLGCKRLDTLNIQARETGFVYQDKSLFPHPAGKEQTAGASGKERKNVPELSKENMELLIRELAVDQPNLERSIKRLPGGIRQLAAFTRTKIYPFELLLMDEPLARLDPETHQLVTTLIRRIINETGKTTIIAFSNARDALALSDYTAIINQGRILQYGITADVYSQPASILAAGLFSCLGINNLTVEVRANRILPWEITTTQADGHYQLLFRTEEIAVADRGIAVHTGDTRFYDGSRKIVSCATPENTLLTLLVPENTVADFHFLPTHPLFFAEEPGMP